MQKSWLRRSLILVAAAALALPSMSALQAQSQGPVVTPPKASTKAAKSKPAALKPFDLNSATEDDLVLAGIDRPAAKKVIAARPFKNKKDLVSKKLLTAEQYNKVKDLVVARQAPKPLLK